MYGIVWKLQQPDCPKDLLMTNIHVHGWQHSAHRYMQYIPNASCFSAVLLRWTTSRVFRTSFWKELGKFLLIFGTYYLLDIIFAIAKASTCALPPPVFSEDTSAAPRTPACITSTILSSGIIYVGFIVCLIWAACIGGPRRTQLRRHLRIAGRNAGGDCCTDWPIGDRGSSSDCCLHYWCVCCALAQEMRTVMHLQALNKLPVGPPEGYEPLVAQAVAPGVDGGMSRVQKVPLATMV